MECGCEWHELISYFVCPQFACQTPKNQKILFSLHGAKRTSKWYGANRSDIGALKMPFSAKMTLANPRLTEGQTRSKSSQNKTFYSFTSNPRFSETFGNFDQVSLNLTWSWLLAGPKNPNFDLTIRMDWDQCHYEDNQILIPETIHGLELELKWLRYWENCEKHVSTLPKVITFDPIVWILIYLAFKKLDIQRFPGTPRSP